MQAVTTIGLDIAKSVFQVHGSDAEGKVVIRRQEASLLLAFSQKRPVCLVGIEALRLVALLGRASSKHSAIRFDSLRLFEKSSLATTRPATLA
jgi:transposase